MNRRTVLIVASSFIALLVIVLFFVFNIGNVRSSFAAPVKKRTITSVKNGNWTDPTIWSTGSLPVSSSSDSIVILNSIILNTAYTVGDKTNTGITIASGGTLTSTGSFTLTLEKSASLKNIGTVSGIKIAFNGNGTTDPISYVTNSGSFSLVSGITSTNPNSVITNSGTFIANGYSKVDSKLINSGTFSVLGGFDSDYGLFTNSGTMSGTGTTTFTGASLTNSCAASSFSVGGDFTLNYGSNTSSMSSVINAGHLNIGTSGAGNFIIHDGNVTNGKAYVANYGPKITVTSSFNIYAGTYSDTNKIVNNGLISVNANIVAYSSIITNKDSITIGGGFTTYAATTNNKMAYIGISGDLTNNSGTGALFNNAGGYVQVKGNFLNNWSATYTGNGGGLSVAGNLVNHGTETGNTDICDKTPNTPNDVAGTKGSSVTTCTFVPPTKGPSALPVTLTKFEASKEGTTNVLNWTTASEINNDRFEIERSGDGATFSVVGTVKGNGTKLTITNYDFTDENPLQGVNYYRLHQVDYNGKSDYSMLAVVNADQAVQAALNIKLYPNPVKAGNTLNLEMDIPTAEELTIDMVNMNGKSVYHNESHVDGGIQTKEINMAGNLKPGMYVLSVIYQGKVTSEKIYVQ